MSKIYESEPYESSEVNIAESKEIPASGNASRLGCLNQLFYFAFLFFYIFIFLFLIFAFSLPFLTLSLLPPNWHLYKFKKTRLSDFFRKNIIFFARQNWPKNYENLGRCYQNKNSVIL